MVNFWLLQVTRLPDTMSWRVSRERHGRCIQPMAFSSADRRRRIDGLATQPVAMRVCFSGTLRRRLLFPSSARNALSERIIGCAFKVSNTLGVGFLENLDENALVHEIRKSGLTALPRHSINVVYDGIVVGEYFADILVNDTL